MSCSKLFVLRSKKDIRLVCKTLTNFVSRVTDYDNNCPSAGVPSCAHNIANHGTAADLMKDFGLL